MTLWMIQVQHAVMHPMVADGRAWRVASYLLGVTHIVAVWPPARVFLISLAATSVFLLILGICGLTFYWLVAAERPSRVACSLRTRSYQVHVAASCLALQLMWSLGVLALLSQPLGPVVLLLVFVWQRLCDLRDAQVTWVLKRKVPLWRLPVASLKAPSLTELPIAQHVQPFLSLSRPQRVRSVSLQSSSVCKRWMAQGHDTAGWGWSGPAQTFWMFPTSDQILRQFSWVQGLPERAVRRGMNRVPMVDCIGCKPLLVSLGWCSDAQ